MGFQGQKSWKTTVLAISGYILKQSQIFRKSLSLFFFYLHTRNVLIELTLVLFQGSGFIKFALFHFRNVVDDILPM